VCNDGGEGHWIMSSDGMLNHVLQCQADRITWLSSRYLTVDCW
jgi:hypothetical protein